MRIEKLYSKIQLQLQQQLPFVVYKTPRTNFLVMLFQKDDQLHYVDDYLENGFVFKAFDEKQQPILIPSKRVAACLYEEEKEYASANKIVKNEDHPGKEAHLELISKGLEAIEKERFEKVVLSRKEEVELADTDILQLYRNILLSYPEAYCYFWYHPATGPWMGATPEVLLTLEDDAFETMALAGTKKFKGRTDVDWNDKEREEQKMITRFILERLGVVACKLDVSRPYTMKAGSLLHLKTDITGTIRKLRSGARDLLQLLHPTPAVCGYRREAAREFILEHEGYDREFYTGFLGELNFSFDGSRISRRQSSIYVNLRCMKISGNKAIVYVGGGITEDSVPKYEWQETVDKAQTMMQVLGKI